MALLVFPVWTAAYLVALAMTLRHLRPAFARWGVMRAGTGLAVALAIAACTGAGMALVSGSSGHCNFGFRTP